MITPGLDFNVTGMSAATAPTAARSNILKATLRVARLVLMGSAGLLLLLGVYIWTGNGDAVIPIHIVLGSALVIALWTVASIAAIAGVSRRPIAVAIAWSLVVLVLGITQDRLLEGDAHWVIQVMHLVISMALAGWGQALVIATHKRTSGIGG